LSRQFASVRSSNHACSSNGSEQPSKLSCNSEVL
jgi:hypothetical protein